MACLLCTRRGGGQAQARPALPRRCSAGRARFCTAPAGKKRESRGAAHMPPAALRCWGAAPAALCQARRRKRTRAGPDGQPSVQRRKKGRTRARRPPQRQTDTPLCAKQNKAPAQNNKARAGKACSLTHLQGIAHPSTPFCLKLCPHHTTWRRVWQGPAGKNRRAQASGRACGPANRAKMPGATRRETAQGALHRAPCQRNANCRAPGPRGVGACPLRGSFLLFPCRAGPFAV